jgi:hypothetical protein
MTRTQIQLPDELYERAKSLAAEKEISLAEIARRGIELFLARFPQEAPQGKGWRLPQVNCGGLRVPLESIKEIAGEEEAARGLRR